MKACGSICLREAYETVDAIDAEDINALYDELGMCSFRWCSMQRWRASAGNLTSTTWQALYAQK